MKSALQTYCQNYEHHINTEFNTVLNYIREMESQKTVDTKPNEKEKH